MNEQPINLRRLLRVLVRGAWIIAVCALVGMVAVAGVRFVRSPLSFTAQASVLLPASPVAADGQPARDANTEVQIARGQTVVDTATGRLRTSGFPKTTSTDLKSRLKVSAVTSDVLEFTVTAGSAREAIAGTNAASNAYLQYFNKTVPASGTKATQLDPAISASNDAVQSAAIAIAIGALFGALVGCTIVLARDARNRKLRTRDDLALAAGVPAVASIATRRPHNRDEWRALFARYEADADEQWSMRRVIRSVLTSGGDSPAHLMIVTLSRDDGAVAIAPQFAACAASAGISTLLVVPPRDASVASLHQACSVIESGRANLTTLGTMSSTQIDQVPAQLIVSVAVAQGGPLDLGPGDPSITLLGVSAGAADPETVAAVATSAADAGHPLAGIVIANPDPRDETSGRLSPARADAGISLSTAALPPVAAAPVPDPIDLSAHSRPAVAPAAPAPVPDQTRTSTHVTPDSGIQAYPEAYPPYPATLGPFLPGRLGVQVVAVRGTWAHVCVNGEEQGWVEGSRLVPPVGAGMRNAAPDPSASRGLRLPHKRPRRAQPGSA